MIFSRFGFWSAHKASGVLLSGKANALRGLSGEVADRCNVYNVTSPFPSIPEGPYPPLYEFVPQNWKPSGGHLDEKVAIIDGSTGLQRTFSDYHRIATGLAGALQSEMNLAENSTVALFCPNHVDYAPIVLAVALCGAKVTPINPMYTGFELDNVLNGSRSSILIVHSSKLDVALESARKCSHTKHVIVVRDSGEQIPEGTIPLDHLYCHENTIQKTANRVHTNTTTYPVCLPYSSGTTGLPKGVCLTHASLVANLLQMEVVERPAFPESHKLISPLPFFHLYAFTVSLLYSAWQGQTVITKSGRFDLEHFCQLVEQHKPERSHLVPPILLGLARHPVVDKYDLSSLKTIISAAAPLSIDTENAVKKRIGCKVKHFFGMSELSPIGTMNSDFDVKSVSVGPLVPSTLGKIIDDEGHSLPPNTPGELCLKGPQVMMGYMDQPEKTAECLSRDGWLRTGDLAMYDEDGFFYITDRIKELIKVRGYSVAPAELEALLLTHEAVSDCAVIQVPDEISGELPRAYIVLKPDYADKVTKTDIQTWVRERVAAYKRLDGGVEFTDTIPKSESGKILRRILRDRVKLALTEFEK